MGRAQPARPKMEVLGRGGQEFRVTFKDPFFDATVNENLCRVMRRDPRVALASHIDSTSGVWITVHVADKQLDTAYSVVRDAARARMQEFMAMRKHWLS